MIIRNTRLVPELSEGRNHEMYDVVVEEGIIKNLLPCGKIQPGNNDINAFGKTLMPGMMDLHMHMYFSDEDFPAIAVKSHDEHFVSSMEYLKEFLDNGFTTVRDCGNKDYIGVSIRDAIARGIIDGPRVFTSGYCISPTAKGNDTFPGLYDEVDSISDIRHTCRKEYSQGIDFLKYMATGSVANVTGEPGALVASKEEIFEMQHVADELGTYLGVHCHGTTGIKYCIEAGVKTIEHASFMTDECINLIHAHGNKTALVPTLSPVVEIYEDVDGTIPAYLKAKIDTIYNAAKMLVKAERCGVLIGWGTDCSLRFFKENCGYEFFARQKVGFSNIEMLKQATVNSAKILGIDDTVGTVAAGKCADLIIVDGNPDEDISVMYNKPLLVMKSGIIKRCSL